MPWHRWISADGDADTSYDNCITCGGHWQYIVDRDNDDDLTSYAHSRHQTWNGNEPTDCTGRTNLCHHDRYSHCDHCIDLMGTERDGSQFDPNCNCMLCTG